MRRETGIYETTSVEGERVNAFVPHALPPAKPPLAIDAATQEMLRAAEANLARLDAAGRMVPPVDWFVYAFVRKEAVISSQIEGTQASLIDLLNVEAEAPPDALPDHVEEICNYLDALSYARRELRRKGGLPLSTRLLSGAHKRLLSGTRGRDKQPGRIRRSQSWIGGTRPGNARFVPPPAHAVGDLLADLERYLHADDGLPLLYLSLYFKRHRQEYYHRLDAIRTNGDWEGWIAYFLEGVAVDILCETGILEETSGRDRDRTYCYREYLDQLRAGTELDD